MPIVAIAALAYTIYSTEQQKSMQKEQQHKQEEALRVKRMADEATTRRKARLRQAQINAGASSMGVGGSLVEGAIASSNTSMESSIDYLRQGEKLNADQLDLASQLSGAQADAQVGKAVGSLFNTFAAYYQSPSTTHSTPTPMGEASFTPNSEGAWGTGGFYGGNT